MINLLATLIITAGVYMPIGDTGCSIYNHHPKPNDSVSVKGGKCVSGMLEGEADVKCAAGTRYIGESHRGKRHGRGIGVAGETLCWGEYRDGGLVNGSCKFGDRIYTGRWKDGKLHGEVVLRMNGRKYRLWFNDGRVVRQYVVGKWENR